MDGRRLGEMNQPVFCKGWGERKNPKKSDILLDFLSV
jgi:hypothetical protein